MASLFFLGLNPRYQYYTWLPAGINLMYSAGGFYDVERRRWRRDGWLSTAGLRWLDSGGFTLLDRYGDYPFSVPEYMNLVVRRKPHYYATMDYPCEPEITRKLGLTSNHERIRATVINAVKTLEWAAAEDGSSHVPGQVVPVIQGYTLAEYVLCLNLHSAFGTIRPYMAVGSMCRRISSSEIGELIRGIHGHAKSLGVERLHFFGLKLSPDLKDLDEFIYSRDSAVAFDDYDGSLRKKRNGRRWPRGREEKRESLESFLVRLGELGLKYCSTEVLS